MPIFKIIRQAKNLISTIKEEPIRGIFRAQDKPKSTGDYIVHEVINVILYIRLSALMTMYLISIMAMNRPRD